MKRNIYEISIAVEIWATDFVIMCMAVAVSFNFTFSDTFGLMMAALCSRNV
jgi:hypothetical protein